MANYAQGDILNIEGLTYPAVVISNDFFNSSGRAIVCPIVKGSNDGPLHIKIGIAQIEGHVICEQLRYVDLTTRRVSKISSLSHYDVLNISDAVMGMFDYQQL